MKKRAPMILLSLCMVFSIFFVGCNKSQNTNEAKNEPTQESEATNENGAPQQNDTGTQKVLEAKTVKEFSAMLVKEGMLKKASELEAKKSPYSESYYYKGYITAPNMASKKNADTMSMMVEYEKETDKVVNFSIFEHTKKGETTPYNSDVKACTKAILKFMNSEATEQQLEEVLNELDPKGAVDQPVYLDNKLGLYYYNTIYKSGEEGQIYVSYVPFAKGS